MRDLILRSGVSRVSKDEVPNWQPAAIYAEYTDDFGSGNTGS
jgi:hypothetical protein